MTVLLKPIEDPARLEWYKACPEQRLNAAERVKKVDHYYLSIDAVIQPMQVREDSVSYEEK
jgi:hypothetical protein